MLTQEIIASAVQKYRFDRGWSYYRMGIACGLSHNTIRNVELMKTHSHSMTIGIIERRCPGIFDGVKEKSA